MIIRGKSEALPEGGELVLTERAFREIREYAADHRGVDDPSVLVRALGTRVVEMADRALARVKDALQAESERLDRRDESKCPHCVKADEWTGAHAVLDTYGIPRHDEGGVVYSLRGRINRLFRHAYNLDRGLDGLL